jgi:hypothetical protein
MGPYPVSLSSQPLKQWGQSQPSVDGRLLGLPGPYLRHVIGTFNTCSRRPAHRSLTDTDGGYHLRGVGFSNHTPRPSQPTVSAFHLRVLSGLQFNQVSPTKPKFKIAEPMATTWSFNHSAIYRGLLLCLPIANDLSLAIGFIRIDQKDILMNLGHQSNSYNLMHIQES